MSPEKTELIQGWYNKGDEDILAAETLLEAHLLLYDIIAFHAQQGAEKYLKAFITYAEILPPKIHDLRELIDIASGFDSSFEDTREAESLSKYAVRSRYPDSFEIDNQDEAMQILNMAKAVRDFVKSKINI